MAQTSWPFENIDTTETQFSQWARNIGEGVKGSVSGTELKVVSGAGLGVSVNSGQALVRGHYYVSTGSEALALATADVTNPRIDTIVLRLDPTANTILLAVLTGTPASSPVAPTITQSDAAVYELPLANVAVAAGATSVGTITDRRTFIAKNVNPTMKDISSGYNILATDSGNTIRSTGSALTVVVDNVLAAGERVDFVQAGAGKITFSAGSGVVLSSFDNKLKTRDQFAAATVLSAGSGVYYLIGNLGD